MTHGSQLVATSRHFHGVPYRFGAEITAQHAENKAALGRIDGKLDRLDTRLDGHGERLAKVEGRLEGRRRRRRGGW